LREKRLLILKERRDYLEIGILFLEIVYFIEKRNFGYLHLLILLL